MDTEKALTIVVPASNASLLERQWLYTFPSAWVKCGSREFVWLEKEIWQAQLVPTPDFRMTHKIATNTIKIPACPRCIAEYEKYLAYQQQEYDAKTSRAKTGKKVGGAVLPVIAILVFWAIGSSNDWEFISTLLAAAFAAWIGYGIGGSLGERLMASAQIEAEAGMEAGSEIGFSGSIYAGEFTMMFENHDFAREFLAINTHARLKQN